MYTTLALFLCQQLLSGPIHAAGHQLTGMLHLISLHSERIFLGHLGRPEGRAACICKPLQHGPQAGNREVRDMHAGHHQAGVAICGDLKGRPRAGRAAQQAQHLESTSGPGYGTRRRQGQLFTPFFGDAQMASG